MLLNMAPAHSFDVRVFLAVDCYVILFVSSDIKCGASWYDELFEATNTPGRSPGVALLGLRK